MPMQRALDQPRQPEGAPSLSLSPGQVLFIIFVDAENVIKENLLIPIDSD